jgi:hypothetical protein
MKRGEKLEREKEKPEKEKEQGDSPLQQLAQFLSNRGQREPVQEKQSKPKKKKTCRFPFFSFFWLLASMSNVLGLLHAVGAAEVAHEHDGLGTLVKRVLDGVERTDNAACQKRKIKKPKQAVEGLGSKARADGREEGRELLLEAVEKK